MLNRLSKYLDNTRAIQAFQMLRFGAQFLTGILLAKTVLSITEIGVFDTFLFIGTSVSFFWVSGFINGLLPLYASTPEGDKPKTIFNAFITVSIINLLICIALYAASTPILTKLYPEGPFPYLGYLLFFLLVNNPAFLVEYILLLKHRSKALVAYGIFVMVLQLAAVVLPVLLGYGLEGAIKGLVFFGIVKYCILLIVLARHSVTKIDFTFIKHHTNVAWPLALSIFVSGSADIVDGYLVSTHFDRQVFAIFRYGARELPIAVLLANAFSTSAMLRIGENLDEGLAFIKQRSRQMMHLLFPLSIILLLSSKYIYPLVFRPAFAASVPVFNIFLLLLVFRLYFPQTILNGLKQTKVILVSSVVEIALNALCSYILLQHYGITGVAWGTVIAFAMERLFLSLYNYWRNGIKPTSYVDVRALGFYTILLVAAYASTLLM